MSWSQKIFLKINSLVGKNKWQDMFMVFCGHSLIYFLGFGALLWGALQMEAPLFKIYVKFLLSAVAGYFVISWLLAVLFRRHRPIVEFPDIKTLIHPLQNWKSFPSDHTGMSFIFVLVVLVFGAPIWLLVIGFLVALTVAFARVYVGVHYPRDILGGIILSCFIIMSADWILQNVTQPAYDIFKSFLP